MTTVAVIAHAGKSMGGGLEELRQVLASRAWTDPFWSEVPKSKYAPERVEKALGRRRGDDLRLGRRRHGPALRRRHGGDRTPLAILPAGTANLFASNLGIPDDIAEAVASGSTAGERSSTSGR